MKLKKSSTDASQSKEGSSKEKSKEKKKPLTSFQSKYYSNPTFDQKVAVFWIYWNQVKQFHKSLKGITAESLTGLSPNLNNLSEFLHNTKHEVILKRAGQNMDKVVWNYLDVHKRVFVEVGQYSIQLKNLKTKVKRRNEALIKFTKWKGIWEQIDPKERSNAQESSKNGKKVAKAKASLEKYEVLFTQVQAAVEDELTLTLLRRFKDLDTYLEKLCRAQRLLFNDLMSTWGSLITFQFRIQNEEAAQNQSAATEVKPEDNMYESQKVASGAIRNSAENSMRFPQSGMTRSPSFPQEEKGRTASSSSLSVNELIPQDQSDTPLQQTNAFFGSSDTIGHVSWSTSGGFLDIWDPFKSEEKKDKEPSDSDESVLSTFSGVTGTEFTNSPFTSTKASHTFNGVDSFDSQQGTLDIPEDSFPSTPQQELKSPTAVTVRRDVRAPSFGGPDDHFSTRFSVHFANTAEIFNSSFGNSFDGFEAENSGAIFGATDSVPDVDPSESAEPAPTEVAVKEVTFEVDYVPTETIKEQEIQIFEFQTDFATPVEFTTSTVTPLPDTQEEESKNNFPTEFTFPSESQPENSSSAWEFSVPASTSAPEFKPIDEIDVDSDSDLDIDWNDIFYKPQSTSVAETTTFDQPVFGGFSTSYAAPPLPVRKNSVAFSENFTSTFEIHFDFEKFKNDPTEIPALPPKPAFIPEAAPTFEPTFYQPPPPSQTYQAPPTSQSVFPIPTETAFSTAPVSVTYSPAPMTIPVTRQASTPYIPPLTFPIAKAASMSSLPTVQDLPTPKPSTSRSNVRRTVDTSKTPATINFAKYTEPDTTSPSPSPRASTSFPEVPTLTPTPATSSSSFAEPFDFSRYSEPEISPVPSPRVGVEAPTLVPTPVTSSSSIDFRSDPISIQRQPSFSTIQNSVPALSPSPAVSTSFPEVPTLTPTPATSSSSFAEPFDFAKYSEPEISPAPSPRVSTSFPEAPMLTPTSSASAIDFGFTTQPPALQPTRTASLPTASSSFSATFDFAAFTAPSTSPNPSLTPSLSPPSNSPTSYVSPSSSFASMGSVGAMVVPTKSLQPVRQQSSPNLGSSFSSTFDFDSFNKNNNNTPAILTPTPAPPSSSTTTSSQSFGSSPSSFSATFDFDKFANHTQQEPSPPKFQLTRSFEQSPTSIPPKPAFNMSASMSMSTLPVSANRPVHTHQMYNTPMSQPMQPQPIMQQPMAVSQPTNYMQPTQPMYPQQIPSQPMYMASRPVQHPVYPTQYPQYAPQYPQQGYGPVYPNAGMPNVMYNIPQSQMMMGGVPMQTTAVPMAQPPQGFSMVRGPSYTNMAPPQSPAKPQQSTQQPGQQSVASSALQW